MMIGIVNMRECVNSINKDYNLFKSKRIILNKLYIKNNNNLENA